MSHHHMQITRALAQLATSTSEPPLTAEALDHTVLAALDSVPGFEHVGISITRADGSLETSSATSQLVRDLDHLQSALREGPCFEPVVGNGVTPVPHASRDRRWPRYLPEAVRRGLRAQLSVVLYAADDSVGRINFYSTRADEIDVDAAGIAELFASEAAFTLGRPRATSHLGAALESRKVVGQALGLLMERFSLSEDHALQVLVRTASASDSSLRAVAAEVVNTSNERAVHASLSPVSDTLPATTPGVAGGGAEMDEVESLRRMYRAAALAQAVAPDLAGFTLISHSRGVIFTVAATDDDVASLDAVQYLRGGPSVEAVAEQDSDTTSVDLDAQQHWRSLAQAAASLDVRCVLTLPLVRGHEVIGTVNLYGRTTGAFDHKLALLSTVFDSWASRVVDDGELSCIGERLVEHASRLSEENRLFEMAASSIATADNIGVDLARALLEQAAACAGAPMVKLARLLLDRRPGDSSA